MSQEHDKPKPKKGKEKRSVKNKLREIIKEYRIHGAAYALKELPPIEYVIDGVISKGSVNLLVGKFGSKKTWSAISAGVCVALGSPWLSHGVEPGPVLFIDEESGTEKLRRRIGNAIRGVGGDKSTKIYFVSLLNFNLYANPDDKERMIELIQTVKAKLVIIDAMVDIMIGGNENSSTDAGYVFSQFRSIAETTGAAIILLHHENRSGTYRGSSAIPGAIDNMISVESPSGSNVIKFKSKKVRDGLPFQFAAEAHWDENEFFMTTVDPENVPPGLGLGEPHLYVLRYLAKHKGEAPMVDIKNNADTCSSGSAQNAIYKLAKLKYIVRSDGGSGGGKRATYRLTSEGKEYFKENATVDEIDDALFPQMKHGHGFSES